MNPQLCGSKDCPYNNLCLAELAGYSPNQCSSAPQDKCPSPPNGSCLGSPSNPLKCGVGFECRYDKYVSTICVFKLPRVGVDVVFSLLLTYFFTFSNISLWPAPCYDDVSRHNTRIALVWRKKLATNQVRTAARTFRKLRVVRPISGRSTADHLSCSVHTRIR